MNAPMPAVRDVRASDRDAWTQLYGGYRSFYRLAPDDETVDRVWGWLLDDRHEVNGLVAEVDGVVCALANYRRFARPSSGGTGLYLDDLFTDPEYRGRGVGRSLIDALDGIASAEGLSVVRWITAEGNATARRLYDSTATATRWVTYDVTPGSRSDRASG